MERPGLIGYSIGQINDELIADSRTERRKVMDSLHASRPTIMSASTVLLILLAITNPLFGAAPIWSGLNGSTSWNDPLNWNPNGVPVAGDG